MNEQEKDNCGVIWSGFTEEEMHYLVKSVTDLRMALLRSIEEENIGVAEGIIGVCQSLELERSAIIQKLEKIADIDEQKAERYLKEYPKIRNKYSRFDVSQCSDYDIRQLPTNIARVVEELKSDRHSGRFYGVAAVGGALGLEREDVEQRIIKMFGASKEEASSYARLYM